MQRPSSPDLPAWAYHCLRCPLTGENLNPASAELVHELLSAHRDGKLVNRQGVLPAFAFDSGLVNESESCFYPATGRIPSLLASEAIPLPLPQ